MAEQKRLLFVTYTFPPARSSGAVRTGNIAKYLVGRGWELTVLTVDPCLLRNVDRSNGVAETLGNEIRYRVTGHRWRWLVPDIVKCSDRGLSWIIGGIARRLVSRFQIERTIGWVSPAERASRNLRPGDVDVILASGPPFSAFSIANRLSRRLGCPYVLDYRDLWSGNLHFPASRAGKVEASVLAESAAVTVVSRSWAEVLDRDFRVGPKLRVISNGYDREELAAIQPHRFDHFAIVYTGRLWPPRRAISPLMAALSRLPTTGLDPSRAWMFHYYGSHQAHVLEEARRFGVSSRVVMHGEVPRATALAAVKGARLAVVITSVAEQPALEDMGMVTGKIFEAIGLGTPTLVIAPSGSDAELVARTTGSPVFTPSDTAGLAAFLQTAMDEEVAPPVNRDAYAWDNIVTALDSVLLRAIGRPGGFPPGNGNLGPDRLPDEALK